MEFVNFRSHCTAIRENETEVYLILKDIKKFLYVIRELSFIVSKGKTKLLKYQIAFMIIILFIYTETEKKLIQINGAKIYC